VRHIRDASWHDPRLSPLGVEKITPSLLHEIGAEANGDIVRNRDGAGGLKFIAFVRAILRGHETIRGEGRLREGTVHAQRGVLTSPELLSRARQAFAGQPG